MADFDQISVNNISVGEECSEFVIINLYDKCNKIIGFLEIYLEKEKIKLNYGDKYRNLVNSLC